jgi:hypothetical protein
LHAYDFTNNSNFLSYSLGDFDFKSRNFLEARAWRTNVLFGYHNPSYAQEMYDKYKNLPKPNGYDVTKWDDNKFFNDLMN